MIPFKEEFSLMKKLYLAAMLVLAFTVNAFAIPTSFSPVVKKAAPSVVNISTTKTVTRQIDLLADRIPLWCLMTASGAALLIQTGAKAFVQLRRRG